MEMNPKQIVDAMYNKDYFSQWLGIERIEDDKGMSRIQMLVRPEMCNGFGIAHGGISYSLADSAFAFASNSQGRKAVSIETTISHVKTIHSGDTLIAKAVEKSLSYKIGFYRVEVVNQNGDLVALFNGTVYRKSDKWSKETEAS